MIGQNSIRPDGKAKVTGKARYAGDYFQEGMLHVALVRSAHAHANLLAINPPPMPEGCYFFTAKHLADNIIVDIINDQPVLAEEKVRFLGEPIAIVAAPTRKQAIQLANAVQVEYEVLPHYIDGDEALHGVAIHESGNLVGTFDYDSGDLTTAFQEADLVLEEDYFTPYQEHAYMECDSNFSTMVGDTLTLYTATQNVFHDQSMVSHALGLPLHKVHVISATVGGGFGGKDGHMTQIFGALVTHKTGKPCLVTFDRQECIAYTLKRHSAKTHIKMGFSKTGKIVAFSATGTLNTGAYIGYGLSVLGLYSEHLPGPYAIEHVSIHTQLVYTNQAPASAFRGFGAPQGNFATESMIAKACELLHLDPIAVRMQNAMVTGGKGPLGNIIHGSCGLKEALHLLQESDFWKNRKEEPNVGYGVACGHLSCGFGKGIPDTTKIKLQVKDNHYTFFIGLTEIGQGGIQSLRAIASSALGVAEEQITIVMSDTHRTYDCGATAASRTTFMGGNAILEVVKTYQAQGGEGEWESQVSFPEADVMQCIGVPHSMYTFVAQAFRVRVNPLTGVTKVEEGIAVTEAGKIINPMQMAGQVCGGMMQSIGMTLYEDLRYNAQGKIINDTFSTYLLPTALDAPKLTCLTVDGNEPTGPNGVKGAAESPTVPTAAALHHAIYRATGKWHNSLPLTPEEILLGGKA